MNTPGLQENWFQRWIDSAVKQFKEGKEIVLSLLKTLNTLMELWKNRMHFFNFIECNLILGELWEHDNLKDKITTLCKCIWKYDYWAKGCPLLQEDCDDKK